MSTATAHSSFGEVARRPVTAEEQAWIDDIVSANPRWADVQLGDLFVVAECACGCRSVVLEAPQHLQNPRLVGHQDLVGEMDINIRFDRRDDVVSIFLHYAEGNLSLLEVVWYNFPEPVPRKWMEMSRELRTGD